MRGTRSPSTCWFLMQGCGAHRSPRTSTPTVMHSECDKVREETCAGALCVGCPCAQAWKPPEQLCLGSALHSQPGVGAQLPVLGRQQPTYLSRLVLIEFLAQAQLFEVYSSKFVEGPVSCKKRRSSAPGLWDLLPAAPSGHRGQQYQRGPGPAPAVRGFPPPHRATCS